MYANVAGRWRLPLREIYNHAASPGIFPVKYNPAAGRRERGGKGGEENLIWKEKWSGGGEEEKWIYDEEGLLSMGWQEANQQEE